MTNSGADRNPVDRLAEEFAERLRRGERPSLAEYLGKYPQHADEIRELFPTLAAREQPGTGAGDLTTPYERGPEPARPTRPERLGDYRILREVGRGGMGVVYEAVQESLGRHVALKVLPGHALLNPTYLERFRREAKAAAKLHHTNIVPVFGVGECDGAHFYAMQFIQGEGLDKVLHDLKHLRGRMAAGSPATAGTEFGRSLVQGLVSGQFAPAPDAAADQAPRSGTDTGREARAGSTATLSAGASVGEYYRSAARLALQVADALAYAHRVGILHRDVKPSNLLLDVAGTVWVTDFGLAKMEGGDELTQTGDIIGTIRYMAPERFDGQSLPQSDVYSLGLTLYELLALRPAFDDTNRARLIDKSLHEAPLPPSRIDPGVPRDLETIVLKCLRKDPAERYPTAEELAEDLRRFLADRPIRARRASNAERAWRWCRRNPAVACLLAAVALSLVLGTIVASAFAVRADASTRQAKDDRDRARAAEHEGKRKLFESYVSEADAIRMSRRPGQRFGTLRRVRDALDVGREIGLRDEDKVRLRNIAVAALCLPDMEPGLEWPAGPDKPLPDGLDPVFRRHLLSAYALAGLPPPVHGLRGDSWYSPDGRFVALGTRGYTGGKTDTVPARVWRIDGRGPVRVLDDLDGAHEDATAFYPDGRQVAFGHRDGTVTVYDTETGRRLRDLPPGPGPTYCLAYHPRLPRLAVANGSEVVIWDIETGKRLLRLGHPASVSAVAWHPRGHRMAVGSGGYQIHLWDAESGRLLTGPWQGHKTDGIRLTFSHAGDRVVSNDWGGVLRLWDAATGQLLLSQSGAGGLHFSSDDQSLGITGTGEVNRLVRLAGGQEMRTLLRPTPHGPEPILSVSVHPGGRLLAVHTASGCGLWDLLTGEELDFVPGSFMRWGGVRLDGTGALWVFGNAGLLRWPVRASADSPDRLRVGPPEWVANKPANVVDSGFSCSADGRIAVVPLRNDGAFVIHRGPPRRTFRLGPQHDVRLVVVSPDGRWVVTGSHWYDESGSRFKVWDADTGRLVANLPYPDVAELGGFSPDSRWLHYSDGKQSQRLEVASLAAIPVRPAGDIAPANARPWEEGWRRERVLIGGTFSPDGGFRAEGSGNGTIRLLAPDAENEIARLPSPETGSISPNGFSPDGTLLLASGAESGALYVFDLRRIREQLAELDLDWDAPPYPPRKPEEARPAVDAPLQVKLLDAEWGLSRPKLAQYEGRKAVERLFLNPFDPDAHYRLGGLLLESGQFADAHAHLTAALAFRPDLETAYLLRAEAAARLKRWDEAAADATRFLEKCPYDTHARLLRADLNRARKRHDEAADDLTAVIATYPQDAELYERRADCYQALGQTDKAATDREKALKIGASDPTRLNNQAWRLVTGPEGARDPARALGLIQKALEREPDNPLLLNTLGVAEYRNRQYAAAVVTLDKSLAASKGRSDGFDLYFLAMCHARLGDPARAKDCFDRAVKWTEALKDPPPHYVEELRNFRAEAEEVLKEKEEPKGRKD
ncbi:MAG TPA: protein kinase [Gemmataceae bacterium]|nr:protein kinase [Gemmataceae bacterium]